LLGELPLGPAAVEAPRGSPSRAQRTNCLVGVRTELSAAISDDLAALRQFGQPLVELIEWDGQRAIDMAGVELPGGTDVDEHHVVATQALAELVAADRLDVVTEVVACGALDLCEPCR
jgi:hypothetical protein